MASALHSRSRFVAGCAISSERWSSRNSAGWLAALPALIFGFATFASIGLPGLANFAGEFMVFVGSFDFDIQHGLKPVHWAVILGLWGVVMSTVYMLRAYRNLFFGKAAAGPLRE